MGAQEELVAAIQNYLQQNFGDTSEASMKKLFGQYDKDGDGRIDKPELTKLLADIDIGNRLTRGTWAKGIIDRLDANLDSTISWEEFRDVVMHGG
jgi:Ca2+-binding EF-hand superfamily protein